MFPLRPGCALNCTFCSTGKQGYSRNLSVAEIIGQVWLANKQLGYFASRKRIISNIVLMGMGEPLLNFDNVVKAVELITDDLGFGLANKRVTLSNRRHRSRHHQAVRMQQDQPGGFPARRQ